MHKKNKAKFSSVSLPTVLLEKVRKEIQGTGFTSVSSYVEYILREIIMNHAEQKREKLDFIKDKEKIKAKLRALGYID